MGDGDIGMGDSLSASRERIKTMWGTARKALADYHQAARYLEGVF